MTIEKTKKTIVISLIICLIVVGSLVFGVVKQFRGWQENLQKIDLVEEKILTLEKNLQRLTLLQEQVSKLEDQLKKLEEALPQHLDEQILIENLQLAAPNPGSQILEIHFDDRSSQAGYGEISFHVVFEGEFRDLLRFLENLEEGSKIYRIDDLSIQGSRGITAGIRADLKMAFFYRS